MLRLKESVRSNSAVTKDGFCVFLFCPSSNLSLNVAFASSHALLLLSR